ncbi:hypothetical protein [Gaoshiqia sp. Z1-71]|uniref:hypothetical protein n=1 Tax=Gaoshiqia hydrogeniformans TaxID=3290090 RepID=UPI003BF7EA98
MKYVGFVFLIVLNIHLFGQVIQQEAFLFEGYVFTEDSIPLENAHLINYRTTKIVTTNHQGLFRTSVFEGDSLKINHVSMSPVTIHARKPADRQNKYYLPYRTYLINPMSMPTYQKEYEHSENNAEQIREEAEDQLLIDPNMRSGKDNPYDDDEVNPGITILKINLKPKNKDAKKEHKKE